MDRKRFLANLRQSKLLTETQVEVARQLPATSGREVADGLVQYGLLTHFQAERLLAGRNTGFVLGPYRILDQLGRGGMGSVFKAEHGPLKRVVALKVLAPRLVACERARGLFLREVHAAAQIVHPNIVAAFDAGEVEGHYFLVLEYVDGPNLDQLVREHGPLPVGLACDYMKQAANGLQAANALGMVHRDIKPSNLLVHRGNLPDSPDLIKISDFGLARLSSSLEDVANTIPTQQNTVMGTPDFLSPEQARDVHLADIRSDLYSLGCTFYYLLTGQVPFPGGTALDKLLRHSAELPDPLEARRPDMPVAVLDIVEQLLSKNPDARIQTPQELAEALQPYAVVGPTPWVCSAPSPPELDAAPTMRETTRSLPDLLEGNSPTE